MKNDHISQLTDVLGDFGVKFAFGVVGSGTSLKLVSLFEENSISYYPVAHEAAAALMAGACCRDGRTRAVAVGIKGPGVVNFLPGILSNYYEARPALTISEAYGPSVPKFYKHKRADHRSLCFSIVKQFATVNGDARTIKDLIEFACQEVPGPIHLDLCNEPAQNYEMTVGIKTTIEDSILHNIEKVLRRIKASDTPAVILGSCVSRKLNKLNWSALRIPVVTTAAAKGCISEIGPYAGGIITGEVKELSPEFTILEKADLIVAFSLRNTEMILAKPFNAPLIIVDTLDDGLHDGFEAIDLLITPDLLPVSSILFEALLEKDWGEDAVYAHWLSIEEELFQDSWLPAVVFRYLQNMVGYESVLTIDTGLFCTIGETVWKARTPLNFCGSSNGRFMGTAIPTAIGVAVSAPERRVICVAGDGGIRPYLPEIKLAIEQKLTIVFILMTDGQYGTVAKSSKGKGMSEHAFKIKRYSWWRSIEAMGCPSMEVSKLIELDDILKQWLKSEGPLFLEMKFNPQKYIKMTDRLR